GKDNTLTRSDQTDYVEPDRRIGYSNAKISFGCKSHLFCVFAAEEISHPKREGTSTSSYLSFLSVVSDHCRGGMLIFLKDGQGGVLFHGTDRLSLLSRHLTGFHRMQAGSVLFDHQRSDSLSCFF